MEMGHQQHIKFQWLPFSDVLPTPSLLSSRFAKFSLSFQDDKYAEILQTINNLELKNTCYLCSLEPNRVTAQKENKIVA